MSKIDGIAVWCKNCRYYDEFSGVCCNPESGWIADFPPEYSSCELCEGRAEDEGFVQ